MWKFRVESCEAVVLYEFMEVFFCASSVASEQVDSLLGREREVVDLIVELWRQCVEQAAEGHAVDVIDLSHRFELILRIGNVLREALVFAG